MWFSGRCDSRSTWVEFRIHGEQVTWSAGCYREVSDAVNGMKLRYHMESVIFWTFFNRIINVDYLLTCTTMRRVVLRQIVQMLRLSSNPPALPHDINIWAYCWKSLAQHRPGFCEPVRTISPLLTDLDNAFNVTPRESGRVCKTFRSFTAASELRCVFQLNLHFICQSTLKYSEDFLLFMSMFMIPYVDTVAADIGSPCCP